MVLQKESNLKLIDTLEEKQNLLSELGIDNLIVQPFSKEFSKLTAIEFTRDILVDELGMSALMIGYDHRFGKNREASVEDLIRYGESYNFEVTVIPAQDISSITVSSTKIRDAIKISNFKKVNQFLGRPYELNGEVIKANGVGRTIKYPTANIEIKETYKLIPPKGVYLVKIYLGENEFSGMMNIGNRPTINGLNETIEIHIFDFDKDIYGKNLKVCFLQKIRKEKKFDSLTSLKNQLKKDEENCKRILAEDSEN
jgi:riboflavin kinase/FMN adenylyltransferase